MSDKGKKVGISTGQNVAGFQTEVITTESADSAKSRELFKQATATSVDDSEKAVDLFREATQYAAKSGTDYGIDVYLRLPRYFQESGRPEEGLREFERLLSEGYPNMTQLERYRHLDKSKIYDKKRLFLQRQGEHLLAVKAGALSLIYDIKGTLTPSEEKQDIGMDNMDLWAGLEEYKAEIIESQKRRQEEAQKDDQARAEWLCEHSRLSDVLTKLLKHAKALDRLDFALPVLEQWAKAQPDVNDQDYERKFVEALGISPEGSNEATVLG